GQSVAVTSQHASNCAPGVLRRCAATSSRRERATISDQSPTQNAMCSMASGSADCTVPTNAGTDTPAGGGGSAGPDGGSIVLVCEPGRALGGCPAARETSPPSGSACPEPGGLSPPDSGGDRGSDMDS